MKTSSPIWFFVPAGIVIKVGALYGFIELSRAGANAIEKQILMVSCAVALMILLIFASRRLNVVMMIWLAILLTFGFTALYQLLGFTAFPGLVKDITPLSWEQFYLTAKWVATLLTFYAATIACVLLVAKKGGVG